MHVPPIIIAQPTEPTSDPAASAGVGADADGEDFAAMIPRPPDDRPGADTTADPRDPSRREEAASNTTADTVRRDDSPGNVIQSLLADVKATPGAWSPALSEIQFAGNFVAAPTAATSGPPPSDDGAARPAVIGQQQASSPPVATLATGATAGPAGAADAAAIAGSATGRNPAGSRDGPMSLATMVTDFTAPAQPGPTEPAPAQAGPTQAGPTGVPPTQPAGGDPTSVESAAEPAGASSTIGSPAIISNPMAGDANPGPLPVPPLAARETALIDPDLGELDLRIAEPGRSRAGKPSASTGTGRGAGAGNGPPSSAGTTAQASGVQASGAQAPGAQASATGGGTAVGADGAVAAARLDAGPAVDTAAPAIEAPSGAAAKASPMASGTNINSALAQGGTANDTAVAFGADVRLGADAVRPAAIEQALRGQPAQPAAEQIAVRISRAVQQGADRITLQLKPGSLGHIRVELEIGPDNRLIAVIAAERPETLDLLQRDARALERALNEAGLKTDSGSLSFNLRGDGGGGANGDNADDAGGDWSSYAAPPNTDIATPIPAYARTPSAGGGIDIRV